MNVEWLTTQEAAQHLKVKPRTLLVWVRRGKVKDFPTKVAAWQVAKGKRAEPPPPTTTGNLRTLVAQYRQERMPQRQSTRRGYNAWLDNHILPKWGSSPIPFLQARPVELWLQSLRVSPKSRSHI